MYWLYSVSDSVNYDSATESEDISYNIGKLQKERKIYSIIYLILHNDLKLHKKKKLSVITKKYVLLELFLYLNFLTKLRKNAIKIVYWHLDRMVKP